MKTTIYFVRHGKIYNPQNILYGTKPYFHLTEEGREQAAHAAKSLVNKQIDLLFASPLLRARQTAKIIRRQLDLSRVSYSKYLLEVKTHLEGQPMKSDKEMNYNLYVSPKRKPSDESLEQVAERMLAFIQKVVTLHAGKRIAAVSHGDPLMVLYAALHKQPLTIDIFEKYPYIPTGGIMKVTIEETGEIIATLL